MSWSMMFSSISATQAAVVPSTSILFPPPSLKTPHTGSSTRPSSNAAGLVIECSSRPQKKATAHHMKTRPRKTQPWDIKRKPTVYAPLPPLPPDWTLASDAASQPVATAGDLEAGLQSPTATG